MEIENDDIDVLLEALTAWESKDFGTDIMFSLMGSIFVDKKDPEAKAKHDESERQRKATAEQESKMRKETSVLLKAKLIKLKQSIAIESITVK
jgi:hypothetical protein